VKADLANSTRQSRAALARCPQCGTLTSEPILRGRTTCRQCGFRFCPECHYYRNSLGTDFCLACGAQLVQAAERRVPPLPGYLDRHVARSVSLINLWFLAWLTLTLGGGPIWLYGLICGSLSLYWLLHFWRFRQRTGLIHASRFIGGVGLSVILTMVALILLQIWLIRPPVHWQSIDLWAFILVALLIVPLGVLGPPALMQSQFGSEIATEATTYATRWVVLERMRYRDTLLLRIPDVRHLPPVPRPARAPRPAQARE
jgi:ribosomal protein L37AE/L43A